MTLRKFASTTVVSTLIAMLLVSLMPSPPATAAAAIVSSGPLEQIDISPYLNCDIRHSGDAVAEWHAQSACGTFIAMGNNFYSPQSIPAGVTGIPYQPVSSTLSGSGTSVNPYVATTVVNLAGTPLSISQRDIYVVGDEFYRTDATVINSGSTITNGIIYTAGDCYLQNSDNGYGRRSGTTATCTTDPGIGGRIESLIPITGGNHWMEGSYSTVWQRIADRAHFPNACTCNTYLDNGIGLSWDLSVPPGGSTTTSWQTAFSPAGVSPLHLTVTADTSSTLASTTDGYTMTAFNNNLVPATLSSLELALPSGFTYTTGSTTGLTTNDPAINGNTVTWVGPFAIESGATGSIHFDVTVSSLPGLYAVDAKGTAVGMSITPADDFAAIAVTGVSDLSVTDVVSPSTALAGENVTYTLTATNAGVSDAPEVVVRQQLPPVAEFISGPCVVAGSTLTCNLGAVASGASVPIIVNVHLGSSMQVGTYADAVSIHSPADDPNLPNNSVSTNLVVGRQVDLSLATSGPTQVVAGQDVSYTVTVFNDGPSDASAVQLVDARAAGIHPLSTSSSTQCADNGVVTCNYPSVPAGQSRSVSISGHVDESIIEGTFLTNTASVVGAEIDSNPTDNDADITAAVMTQADLQISKQLTAPMVAGQTALYSLSVVNNGPSVAQDVVVVDTLPAGLNFDATLSSVGCAAVAQVVTCPQDPLFPGPLNGRVVMIAAQVPASTVDATLFVNSASVASTTFDPNVANNASASSDASSVFADLAVAQSSSPEPLTPGGPLSYTIDVSNIGPSDATDAVLTDALPSAFTVGSPPPGCSAMTATVTCNIPLIAAGTTSTITIIGTAAASASPAVPISNSASVFHSSDRNIANNSAVETTNVVSQTGLSLAELEEAEPAIAGAPHSYVITATNTGVSDATGVMIADTLPAEYLAATVSAPGCSVNGREVSCSLGTLAANGGTDSVTITATLDASIAAGVTVTNTATVTDGNGSSDEATETTSVERETDLDVTKSLVSTAVIAGSDVVWQINVTNNGNSDSSGYQLLDSTISPAVAITNVIGPSGSSCSTTPGSMRCTMGSLPNGDTHSYLITGVIPQDATGMLDNAVQVTTDDPDPDGPNIATSSDLIRQEVDLSLHTTGNRDSVLVGQSVKYTLTVHNSGPSVGDGVTVVDDLPPNLEFDADNSSAECTPVDSSVTCFFDGLVLNGADASVVIAATAASSGSALNKATVSSGMTDTHSSNDSSTVNTNVLPVANVSLSEAPAGSSVIAGGSLVYTLTASNAGPSVAQNVVVTGEIPTGTSVTNVSDPTTCDVGSVAVTCSFSTIAPSASKSVEVTFAVDPTFVPVGSSSASLLNAAHLTSSSGDGDTSDDSVTTAVAVNRSNDLLVDLSSAPDPVVAGTNVTYTVTVANRGPSSSDAITLHDTLPVGVTIVPELSDPSCVVASVDYLMQQRVMCGLATSLGPISLEPISLGPMQSHLFTLVGRVDAGLGSDANLLSAATATSSDVLVEQNDGDNSAISQVAVERLTDLSLALRFEPGFAVAGTGSNLVTTLTNSGPSTAKDVVFTIILPPGSDLAPIPKGAPQCTRSGQAATCSIPTIAAGDTISFSPFISLDPSLLGTIVASGEVSSPDDQNSSNNTSTTALNVIAGAPVNAGGVVTEVLGETVVRGALADTGENVTWLLLIALGLIAIGSCLCASLRARPAITCTFRRPSPPLRG